ncbi:hypothetical protein B0H14DRAFT_2564502 [Mycena olivaceomarginata]|nr:hypothetical protein B0H14DRAFT_2564502 [Mycena olivaceomarginata]
MPMHTTHFLNYSRSNFVDRTDSSDAIGTNGDQQISHRKCHDSGAIYFASAIAFATIGFTLDPIYATTGAVLGQLVGIAPTIIAVRVGLGRSVSHPNGTRSRDEEAHGGLRNDTGGKEQRTSKASSLDPQIVCMC